MNAIRYFLLHLILFLTGVFCYKELGAQDVQQAMQPVRLKTAVWYDFPQSFGGYSGLTWAFRVREKTVISCHGRVRHRRKTWVAGGAAGFYRYPFNHSGLWLSGAIGQQQNWSGRFELETRLGQGILRIFYDGKVYAVDDQGRISAQPLGGRWYALTQLTVRPGWQIGPEKSIGLFIEPALWLQYPYNSFVLPHGACSLGLTFRLHRWHTMARVTSITKTKRPCAH